MTKQQKNLTIYIGSALVLLALAWLIYNPDIAAAIAMTVGIGLIAIVVLAVWSLPMIIAVKRDHPSKMAIILINVFFGWTFLGYIISLVWSLSNNTSGSQTVVINQGNVHATPTPAGQPAPAVLDLAQPNPAQRHYEVGDVVNSHRWNGQAWIPTTEPSQL